MESCLHVNFTFLFFYHFLLSFRKKRLPKVYVKFLFLVESGSCLRFSLFLTRSTETVSLVIILYTLLRDLMFMLFRVTLFKCIIIIKLPHIFIQVPLQGDK